MLWAPANLSMSLLDRDYHQICGMSFSNNLSIVQLNSSCVLSRQAKQRVGAMTKQQACLQHFCEGPGNDLITHAIAQGLLVRPQGLDCINCPEVHLQDCNAGAAQPDVTKAKLLLPSHLPFRVPCL